MSKGTTKIIHFPASCIGCNSCVENAPNNWEIDSNDGRAVLKHAVIKNGTCVAKISEPEVADNQRAAFCCPLGIIQVIDENGKDISME